MDWLVTVEYNFIEASHCNQLDLCVSVVVKKWYVEGYEKVYLSLLFTTTIHMFSPCLIHKCFFTFTKNTSTICLPSPVGHWLPDEKVRHILSMKLWNTVRVGWKQVFHQGMRSQCAIGSWCPMGEGRQIVEVFLVEERKHVWNRQGKREHDGSSKWQWLI